MSRRTKADLEAELARARVESEELRRTNAEQLQRLVDHELLKTRLDELERSLDQVIDEREDAKALAQKWEAKAKGVA